MRAYTLTLRAAGRAFTFLIYTQRRLTPDHVSGQITALAIRLGVPAADVGVSLRAVGS